VKRGKAGVDSLKTAASYVYDIRDLRVMTTKAGATTYYQYDQSGDLLWTECGGENTKYVQDLGQVWAEIRTESGESAVYYHHADHLGTTELVTDEGGQVVWNGSYEAFGSLSRSNGSIAFTPSYTGKQVDEDTGLYYFNARWYDAELGRFVSEDPAREGDNWVAYAGNRPLVMVDPSGLEIAPPGSDKMDDEPWGSSAENSSGGLLRDIGCLITAISNGIRGLGKAGVDPGEVNTGSNFGSDGFIAGNAANAYGLKYSTTSTGISSKLKELKESTGLYSVVVDAWFKPDGSKDKTHSLGVLDYIEGPTGPYVRVQGTSSNDTNPNAGRRESWVRNEELILIPIKDVTKVRWIWE